MGVNMTREDADRMGPEARRQVYEAMGWRLDEPAPVATTRPTAARRDVPPTPLPAPARPSPARPGRSAGAAAARVTAWIVALTLAWALVLAGGGSPLFAVLFFLFGLAALAYEQRRG